MSARRLSFAGTLLVLACSAPNLHGQGRSNETSTEAPTIEQLLSRVPDGAAWQELTPDLRAELAKRASSLLVRDRQSWGLSGLQQKEDLLLSAPTPAMTENIDRILSVTYASELPGGFKLSRDVENPDLKRLLVGIYLSITDDRGYMLYNHPDFMAWDGLPVKVAPPRSRHFRAMALWQQQTEDGLRRLPDGALTPLEKALRAKSYFKTRAGKHFERPAVGINGSMSYSNLYARPIEQRPFANDTALLDAYNASMFTEFREVNMGTLDAFMFDYESEFNLASLKDLGMSDALANDVLKLGTLFLTRVQDLPRRGALHDLLSRPEGRELGRVHRPANRERRRLGNHAVVRKVVCGHCHATARRHAGRRAADPGASVS